MKEALAIVIIILAVSMVVLVLVQSKGADLGGFIGGGGEGGGVQRTRRGVEAILHQVTIGLSTLFFIFVLVAFFVWGG